MQFDDERAMARLGVSDQADAGAVLADYRRLAPLRRNGAIYDLPLARTAIKRLRRILGITFYGDHERWWLQRLTDVLEMPGAEFARLHAVAASQVSEAHKKFFGCRLRPHRWWASPAPRGIILSALPRIQIAEKLDISVGAVGRLRWILRREPKPASASAPKQEAFIAPEKRRRCTHCRRQMRGKGHKLCRSCREARKRHYRRNRNYYIGYATARINARKAACVCVQCARVAPSSGQIRCLSCAQSCAAAARRTRARKKGSAVSTPHAEEKRGRQTAEG